jgi:hypothetical protein
MLYYHLILVVKYRRMVIDDTVSDRARQIFVKRQIEGGGNGGFFSETMPPQLHGRICESTLLTA